MLRLASDENFDEGIVRGLLEKHPELDFVRIRDEVLAGADDPQILAWAADDNRVVLTHDRQTMPGFAYDRVNQGLPMPGVFVVSTQLPIGKAIEDILILVLCCLQDDEWKDQVVFIPMGPRLGT